MATERSNTAQRHQPATCFSCQNRDRSEWCTLPQEDLEALNKARICNHYQTGQIIFYQGNPCLGLYCIESGTVGVRKTDPQGNSVLVRLANAGQTLGYRTFFSGDAYQASAVAMEPCNICFIDRAAVRNLLERNPSLGMRFLKRMAEDLQHSENAYLQGAYLPVRARLAHLLLTLKDHYASMAADGTWTMRMPILKQDIASMLGARPETLSRAIRELEQDGVIQFDEKIVCIPDLDALLDEVEFCEK